MSARVVHLIVLLVLSCCVWAVYAAEPGWPTWVMVGISVLECIPAFVILGGVAMFEREQKTEHAHDLRRIQIETAAKSRAKKPLKAVVRY